MKRNPLKPSKPSKLKGVSRKDLVPSKEEIEKMDYILKSLKKKENKFFLHDCVDFGEMEKGIVE